MNGESGKYGGENIGYWAVAEKRMKGTTKWEDNIKVGLNEIGKKGVDSMKLALDKEG
jgi:hypothetical protein